MPIGWKNPKVKYNFTLGEYEDKKKNYPDLTWKQYRDMKGYPDISNDAIGNSTDPTHYHLEIEPWDFIHANKLSFAEGNVIKYICRWREKGGVEDLKKAKQYIDMLIAKELIKNGEV